MMYDEETLHNLLKTHFGWQSFRKRQVEAIQAVLSGENVFIRSATGSGKSLTWQLPALARTHIAGEKKLTVVIYPTKSLLMDQAAKLQGLDLKVVCCHGDQAVRETQKALVRLEPTSNNMPDILLTLPEYLASTDVSLSVLRVLHRLQQADKLGLIVIDEAQQVLQWGRIFRPAYITFASVISEEFPRVPRLALSAAITKKNMHETVKILGMEKHMSICETLDHPNVYYEVRRKENTHIPIYEPHIRDLLRKGQGIIYCTTRRDTVVLTTALSQAGVRVDCYNGGLEAGLRGTAAMKWTNGEIDVLVATPAFMFGIDNPNVRWVVWDSFPSSIENWVQGSGRAGRDGEKAWSVIYYKPTDEENVKSLWKAQDDYKFETEALGKLTEILNDPVSCRRYKILTYFGEESPNYRCNNCDNCTSTSTVGFHHVEHDTTRDAQDIVRLLQKMTTRSRRETRHTFIATILGKKSHHGIPDLPLQIKLPNGQPSQRQHIAILLSNLIRENIILEERQRYGSQHKKLSFLTLGPRASDLLDGSLKLAICYPAAEELTTKGSNSAKKKQKTNRRRNPKFQKQTDLKTTREIIEGREIDFIVLD